MRISDWSSDVCSSDLDLAGARGAAREANAAWRRPAANPHHRLRRDRRRDPAHDPPLDRRRLGDKLCARPAVALAGAAARPLQRAVSWHPPASLRLQRSGRHLRPGDRPLHPLRPRELGRLLVAALERPPALSGPQPAPPPRPPPPPRTATPR